MTLERWRTIAFIDQIGHIGSEITRARVWQDKGRQENRQQALERALHLVDLTIDSCYRGPRTKELTRLREVISDHYCSAGEYMDSLAVLEDYCNAFALMPRRHERA